MQSWWDNLTEHFPLGGLDVMQDPKWPYRVHETITLFVGLVGKVMHGAQSCRRQTSTDKLFLSRSVHAFLQRSCSANIIESCNVLKLGLDQHPPTWKSRCFTYHELSSPELGDNHKASVNILKQLFNTYKCCSFEINCLISRASDMYCCAQLSPSLGMKCPVLLLKSMDQGPEWQFLYYILLSR